MAKKFFEMSEEEKKVLEGTEAGKALLKKLESAAGEAEREVSERETRLTAAEKARKDLEDSLLNPDILEAIASKRQPPKSGPVEEENLDELPPSKLAARIRKEYEEKLQAQEKATKQAFENFKTGVIAAFHQIQVEALEDKHGEKFTSRKEKLAEFSMLPENRGLRPRDVYAKFVDKEELEAKRQADAAAKAAEAARQKELESFAENPDSTIASGAAGEKAPPKNADEAFDNAWKATPGAEKLLQQQ